MRDRWVDQRGKLILGLYIIVEYFRRDVHELDYKLLFSILKNIDPFLDLKVSEVR